MKKLLIATISLAATMCTFTSCEWDDDVTKGMVLSGCWEGDFSMSYTYSHRGHYYTVDAIDTDLEFIPYSDSYTRGYGYQVDYYRDGPWDEVYHSFTWEVQNSIIYLDYCRGDEEELTTFLRDYNMTNDYLTGYFGNTNTKFHLRKYEDYYDWTPYLTTYGGYYGYSHTGSGYGYHEYDDWYYYARTRAAEDSTAVADDEAPKMVRYFNRNVAQ